MNSIEGRANDQNYQGQHSSQQKQNHQWDTLTTIKNEDEQQETQTYQIETKQGTEKQDEQAK